ncbi:uncharacterized protein B0H18DRAFT_1057258, partial [Fomitopsis serialis]|uniref:uncharacterized protein n=1 Tax=Fomitopsis serialis TaxID=139415 RepID=UPI002007CB83
MGGRGVDHVIGAGTSNKSLASMRYGGTVSVIGFVGGVDILFHVYICPLTVACPARRDMPNSPSIVLRGALV